MTDEQGLQEGIDASEKFYAALLEYLGLPQEKTPETVVRSAFGAVEFAIVVAMQAQVPEDQFKETVDAIWKGIGARRANDGNGEVGEESTSGEEPGADAPSA